MVHFSGFARKMNHIPLFCERSERGLSDYDRYKKRVKPYALIYTPLSKQYFFVEYCAISQMTNHLSSAFFE
ncbi:MAG: hypothetical protein U5L45_21285 [Saprospiraceae bacterium]|nr:hypothetical protein [Saprospiraceae bacterium]